MSVLLGDNMREWKKAIESVTEQKNLFNSRHHWDMRTKFLEVRLRCMDKIVEEPFAIRLPVTEFYVPMNVYEAIEEIKRKLKSENEAQEKKKQDFVSEEMNEKILPSPRKPMHASCVEDEINHNATPTTSPAPSEKRVEESTVDAVKRNTTVSSFQRLRRRIRNLFSCFRNNKVIPVNI